VHSKVDTTEADALLRRMSHARKILRFRQMFVVIFGGGVGLVLVFLAAFIPWKWEWIILGTAAPEAIGHVIVELLLNRPRSQGKTSSQMANRRDLTADGTGKDDGRSSGRMVPFLVDPAAAVAKGKKKSPWRQMLSMVVEEGSSRPPQSRTSAHYKASVTTL
jgi:hypothetical protein